MIYYFVIEPKPGACERCKRDAYQDGGPDRHIYMVDSEKERVQVNDETGTIVFLDRIRENGVSGIVHPNCRCTAHVVTSYDPNFGTRMAVLRRTRKKLGWRERAIEKAHEEAEKERIAREQEQESKIGEVKKSTEKKKTKEVRVPDTELIKGDPHNKESGTYQAYRAKKMSSIPIGAMHTVRRIGDTIEKVVSSAIVSLFNNIFFR